MNLTIRLLGCEVLAICTDDQADSAGPGDATAYPVGFTPTMPNLTAGRYGPDDPERWDDKR